MKYSAADLKKAIDTIMSVPHDDNIIVFVDNATNFLTIKFNNNLETDPVVIQIPPSETGQYAKVITTKRLV